jgi:hypothetical protein
MFHILIEPTLKKIAKCHLTTSMIRDTQSVNHIHYNHQTNVPLSCLISNKKPRNGEAVSNFIYLTSALLNSALSQR